MADSARHTSRKGGRFVPASTDSLLSVTFMSLQFVLEGVRVSKVGDLASSGKPGSKGYDVNY